MQRPEAVAECMAAFLVRHPLTGWSELEVAGEVAQVIA
jgi:hypothetical protein